MVPNDLANGDPFPIGPGVETTAGEVRDWISGLGFLRPPESRAELREAVRWMPANRADWIEDHWTPPRHVIAREAERVRQVNAAFPPTSSGADGAPREEGKEKDE